MEKQSTSTTGQNPLLSGVTSSTPTPTPTHTPISNISIDNNENYVLTLKHVTLSSLTNVSNMTSLETAYNYQMINTFFKNNRQKIYNKISEFNLKSVQDKRTQTLFNLNTNQTMNKDKFNDQLTTDNSKLESCFKNGGQYLYALNKYKAIMVNENKEEIKKIEERNKAEKEKTKDKNKTKDNTRKNKSISTHTTPINTEDHTVREYLDSIIGDMSREYIIEKGDIKNINFPDGKIDEYRTDFKLFLRHIGNFLLSQFQIEPITDKDMETYSINFSHEDIANIKCSNCIDLNNEKKTNTNCTLFSDIKIENAKPEEPEELEKLKKKQEDLKKLKKMLYNIIIFFQSYGRSIYFNNFIEHSYDPQKTVYLTDKYKIFKIPAVIKCFFFDTYETKKIIIYIVKLNHIYSNRNDRDDVTVYNTHLAYIVYVFYADEYEIEKNSYVYLDIKSISTIEEELNKANTLQNTLQETRNILQKKHKLQTSQTSQTLKTQSIQMPVKLLPDSTLNSTNTNTQPILTPTNTNNSITNTDNNYLLKLKKLEDKIDLKKLYNYQMINTFFKNNKQKIYNKISEFNLKSEQDKRKQTLFNLNTNQTMNQSDFNKQLATDKKTLTDYFNKKENRFPQLYALNTYKAIMVNENKEETEKAKEKTTHKKEKEENKRNNKSISTHPIPINTENHTVEEYLHNILLEIKRLQIIKQNDIYMIDISVEQIDKYRTDFKLFLIHINNFLLSQFQVEPLTDKDMETYSINFSHEDIANIKCSNCIDLNNKKETNTNCTLFSDIKIENANEEDLKKLKKMLYNIIIFFQVYGDIVYTPYNIHILGKNIENVNRKIQIESVSTTHCIFFDTYEQKNIIIRIFKLDYLFKINNEINYEPDNNTHAAYIAHVFYLDEYDINKNAYVYLDIKPISIIEQEFSTQIDKEKSETETETKFKNALLKQQLNEKNEAELRKRLAEITPATKLVASTMRFFSGKRGGCMRSKTNINKRTHKINNKLIHKTQYYKSKYNKNIKHKSKTKQH